MLGIGKKLTTEHTEKIFYFKRITDILLPPLCVLSIIVLFFPCFCSSKFIRFAPLRPALQKTQFLYLLCYKKAYNLSVIPIKKYSLGEHRESLWRSRIPEGIRDCGFILFPLFFIEL